MCEPFEKTSSVLDCGPYTPDGYVDLWAAKAYASHQDVKSCPASLVTGEPVVKVSEGMAKNPDFARKSCAVKLRKSLLQECTKAKPKYS